MGGDVGEYHWYGIHSQYFLGFGFLAEGEYLVAQCWSWLDGELSIGNILGVPVLVMATCQREHFGIEKDPPDAPRQLLASWADYCKVEMLLTIDRCSKDDIEFWVRSSAKTIPLLFRTSAVIGWQMTHACVSAVSSALLVMSWFMIKWKPDAPPSCPLPKLVNPPAYRFSDVKPPAITLYSVFIRWFWRNVAILPNPSIAGPPVLFPGYNNRMLICNLCSILRSPLLLGVHDWLLYLCS